MWQILEFLERGEDGQWSIDYLTHLHMANQNSDLLKVHRDQLKYLISVESGSGRTEILSKIRWAASYHNRTIKKFTGLYKKFEDSGDSLEVDLD